MIKVHRISTTEEFTAIRKEWNSLLSVSNANSIFLTWEWAFSWWENFSNANNTLFVLTIIDDNKIVAIAPLVITKKIYFGFFSIREINFLGGKTVHGEYLDFIISPEWESRKVISCIFDYINEHKSQWDIIRLMDIPEKSASIQCAIEIGKDKHYRLTRRITSICPFIVLPDSWTALHASLKKSMLKNFKYQTRRLQKKIGATIELYDTQCIDIEIEVFLKLHESRWSSKGLPGAFIDKNKRLFYHSIANRFSKKNWLSLWFLKINSKPIAALFGFKYCNKFYYLQSGFDPEWSKYSIGQVLLGKVIENAILEGCQEFDFLRGAESYKYDWGAIDKRNIKLEISHRSIKTTLFYTISFLKNKLWNLRN